jgi:hypothetical protein
MIWLHHAVLAWRSQVRAAAWLQLQAVLREIYISMVSVPLLLHVQGRTGRSSSSPTMLGRGCRTPPFQITWGLGTSTVMGLASAGMLLMI